MNKVRLVGILRRENMISLQMKNTEQSLRLMGFLLATFGYRGNEFLDENGFDYDNFRYTKDSHLTYDSPDFTADVVFGENIVFMIVRTSEKTLQILLDVINEKTEFYKET